MKILLIAGHGGTPYDSGAVGCGYTEAVETRRMANAVAPLLRSYGFEVALYDQSKDAYKVVTQGGSLPLSGISYVLEFHLNSAANDPKGNGRTTGTEIFVHTNEQGVGVEQAILRRVCALGFTDRGVKRSSGLAVLKHVFKRGVSHALVETCFIDDRDDMALYGAKFDAIAKAIADGVAEGFGKTVQDEEDDTMTQKEFEAMYDKANPLYKTISDVPDYWKQAVREMLDSGAINGGTADNPDDVNMRHEALQAAIVAYRATNK
ncbi:N-acetylmuramoyl-L-alanine amidase [Intestinibacillus sp. NTUH-41-i26]|uniref:N-acetylmuramoyl-L-alanine amidase n=1 Tax=Intestinibacillus sp. NTUH-41-i26 TaxID=3079303 RepID=UPI002934E79D|nr:N-acetylmuramoyl-L-alanine amidase [Intestinibacillus sp. NTUH-41-i26]WOC75233.1 N-acetylmuramoyl-L-alanine amidase [Intestinibacillus sp. NTUH-41-i26]